MSFKTISFTSTTASAARAARRRGPTRGRFPGTADRHLPRGGSSHDAIGRGGAAADIVERRRREVVDARHEAEQFFRRASARAGLRRASGARLSDAALAAAVAHGRCADLLFWGSAIPRPGQAVRPGIDHHDHRVNGAASDDRPTSDRDPRWVRMCPSPGTGGREASRAVADALPLLGARANKSRSSRSNAGPKRIRLAVPHCRDWSPTCMRMASRRASAGTSPKSRVARARLSRAADLSSDLIVMGGYGHARLREFVLGGATRTMLETDDRSGTDVPLEARSLLRGRSKAMTSLAAFFVAGGLVLSYVRTPVRQQSNPGLIAPRTPPPRPG